MGYKFGHTKTQKKPYFAANVSQPDKTVKSVLQEKRRKFIRRENILNKLFMKFAKTGSDGHIANLFVGKGIEISRVKISPDFQIIFVLWIAKEQDD